MGIESTAVDADAGLSAWRRVRRRLGRVRAQRGYARLLPRGAVGYVGWAGRGNVGDDALLEAHRMLLADRRFVCLPNLGPSPGLRLAGWLARGRPFGAVCLGGGTLIGNGHFRTTLEAALEIQPDAPRFMLGTGAESEEFELGNRRDVRRELERWVPLLDGFDPVRVRGPRSAASLEALGVAATVVGDPALLLGEGLEAETRPGLLGLNLGLADDRWGEVEPVLEATAALGRVQLDRGGRVRVLAASTGDSELARELARRIGPAADLVVDAVSPTAFMAALSECEVVVAEKLHAVVLAASVRVPAVALEYRPKCRDFQESVGRGSYVVRTDAISLDRLVGLVDEIGSNRAREVDDLTRAVDELRRRLRSAGAEILRSW